jgi:YesN/AraC family two-component response regulator
MRRGALTSAGSGSLPARQIPKTPRAIRIRRGDRRGRTRQIVSKAKEYIKDNYACSDLSLDRIAEHAAAAPCYMSAVFKKLVGVSLSEYLTALRMERARLLIAAAPTARVAEIAEMTGYSDPYYFSRCFRKRFGLPPSQYRRLADRGASAAEAARGLGSVRERRGLTVGD